MRKVIFKRLALVGLAFALTAFAGCKTTEEDLSRSNERPWNTPKNWESGLPSSIYEGR